MVALAHCPSGQHPESEGRDKPVCSFPDYKSVSFDMSLHSSRAVLLLRAFERRLRLPYRAGLAA